MLIPREPASGKSQKHMESNAKALHLTAITRLDTSAGLIFFLLDLFQINKEKYLLCQLNIFINYNPHKNTSRNLILFH